MLKKIPINNVLFKDTDEVGLDELTAERINADVDLLGNIINSPGLQRFVTLTLGGGDIQGLYYWQPKDLVIAVSGGRIYKITRTGTVTDITGADIKLLPKNRVSFASDKDYLFMANGGRIVFYADFFVHLYNDIHHPAVTNLDVDGALSEIRVNDILGDHVLWYPSDSAPSHVSHLAIINKVLVCNNVGSDLLSYSEVNVLTKIDAGNFFTAESNTDGVVALFSTRNELIIVGTKSIEFWETGTDIPFIRVGGQDIARGTNSPHTCKIINNTLYMIDNERRLARVVRNIQDRDISIPALSMSKELDSFSEIQNLIADHVIVDGKNYYVLTSPVDEKTYVFDLNKNEWVSRWAYWDEGIGQWKRWRGNFYLHVPEWDAHLVGDCANGNIYKMTTKVNTEDAHFVRRILVRTGHISWGTYNDKQSNILTMKLKMDADRITAKNSKLSLRWRDNNGEWENERVIDLGSVGKHEFIREESALGMYRTRQYELEYYGDARLMVCGIEEDFQVLEN